MKTSKPAKPSRKSRGTLLAEELRAECNHLTDSDRERLGNEFNKLFYGASAKTASTHRR
jgi:hypothetical protein